MSKWPKETPDSLYRYRALSTANARLRLEDELLGAKLFFAPFSALNDPFEGHIVPEFDSPSELVRAYWMRHLPSATLAPGESLDEVLERIVSESGASSTQDELTSEMRRIIAGTGVCCFADSATSVPMWSYYADDHSGVCLRFRTTERFKTWLVRDKILIMRVTYAREYPRVKYYEAEMTDNYRAALCTKSEVWAHEREWRLARNGFVGQVEFPVECVDGVILGARISDEDREFVRKLIGRRAVPTEVIACVVNERSFSLSLATAPSA